MGVFFSNPLPPTVMRHHLFLLRHARGGGGSIGRRLTSSLAPPQSDHKALHKPASRKKPSLLQSIKDALGSPSPLVIEPETGTYNPFPDFPYTGSLKAVYPLSPTRKLPDHIQRPDYHADGIPRSEYAMGASMRKIAILNEQEIEGMRTVCRLAREVLDIAAAAVAPGVTTDEIDEIVHKACIERNVSFPSSSLPRLSTKKKIVVKNRATHHL
jgi:hypothetical protein